MQDELEIEGQLEFADHDDRRVVALQRQQIAASDFAFDDEAEPLEEGLDRPMERRLRRLEVNTSELVAKTAQAHSVRTTQAQAIVASMLRTILGAAANGEEISLPGFGKFKVKETPERAGRNPTSGEKIKIAASRKLSYSPAKAATELLNG